MEILVTGATGFVGKELVRELAKNKKNNVTCFVRKKSDISQLRELDVKFVYGNILDKGSVEIAVRDKEVVYHLVGEGVLSAMSEDAYENFKKINLGGTKNLLDACVRKEGDEKIRKIVYLSSTSAMGLIEGGIIDEKTRCNPITPYQRSKFETEQLVLDYHKKYKLPIVTLRPCMIYGPGADNSEMLRMCRFIKGHVFPFLGKGDNTVPVVHVMDVVNATILAAKKGKNGEVYIVTNQENPTLEELVNVISKQMNVKVVKIKVPKIVSKVMVLTSEIISKLLNVNLPLTRMRLISMTTDRRLSTKKAEEDMGYRQRISLEAGIGETVKWYKEKHFI